MLFTKKLNIDEKVISELSNLKEERKFLEDINNLYPGAASELNRLELQNVIDSLIDNIKLELKKSPTKSCLLKNFKFVLKDCKKYDTEDRERICFYLEKIMDIVGVKSSNGLLNMWMYGF